jgi:phage FluMu protein Com
MNPVCYKAYIPCQVPNQTNTVQETKTKEIIKCPICWEVLKDNSNDFVFHEDPPLSESDKKHKKDDGYKHPICRICAKKIAEINVVKNMKNRCPTCKVSIDPQSLLEPKTISELKSIHEMKLIKKDLLLGAAVGAVEIVGGVIGIGIIHVIGKSIGISENLLEIAMKLGGAAGVTAGLVSNGFLLPLEDDLRDVTFVFAKIMGIFGTFGVASVLHNVPTIIRVTAAIAAAASGGSLGGLVGGIVERKMIQLIQRPVDH